MSAEQQLARFWEVQDMFLSMRVADSIWPDALFNSAVTSEISPSGVYGPKSAHLAAAEWMFLTISCMFASRPRSGAGR